MNVYKILSHTPPIPRSCSSKNGFSLHQQTVNMFNKQFKFVLEDPISSKDTAHYTNSYCEITLTGDWILKKDKKGEETYHWESGTCTIEKKNYFVERNSDNTLHVRTGKSTKKTLRKPKNTHRFNQLRRWLCEKRIRYQLFWNMPIQKEKPETTTPTLILRKRVFLFFDIRLFRDATRTIFSQKTD